MIDKLLIAINGTPQAMHAANYGIKLGELLQCNIGICYVTEHSLGNIDAGVTPAVIEKALQQRHDALMDEIKSTHPNVFIEEFNPIGIPYKEIENLIELWQPDLLVLGHHTPTFLRKIVGHNLENKIIKNIKIPLLIVPNKE